MQSAPSSPTTPPDKSLIAQGNSRYLAYKCDECHGANGEGGPDGPALVTTYMDAGMISRFLENPSPDAYMKGMPNIPVKHPDHQALVAYVVSLKRSADPPKSDSPAVHTLSAAEKAHVLDGEFTIEKNVNRLPDSLKSAFAHLAKEADFKMANPGEKFQATDAISEPGLRWRRLIFAGTSKDRFFIHYEKGGIALTVHTAVFDVSPEGRVSFLCGGPGVRAKDLAELRTFVSSKAFADGSNYW